MHVYCNKACQKEGWKAHKNVCNDIQLGKVIERAADITQKAYLSFREHTFDNVLVMVKNEGSQLVMYDGDQRTRSSLFLPFPNDRIDTISAKNGVLCYLMCNEPLAFMKTLVARLLLGHKVKTEEITISIKHPPRTMKCIMPGKMAQENWPNFFHEILRLTSTKTGRQWAIDISGPQYGLVQSCWDWQYFKNAYIDQIHNVFAFRFNEIMLRELGKIPGNPTLVFGAIWPIATYFDEVVESWMTGPGMELSKLLMLGDAQYEAKQAAFLDHMDAALKEHMKTIDTTNVFRTNTKYEAMNPGASQRKQDLVMKELRGCMNLN